MNKEDTTLREQNGNQLRYLVDSYIITFVLDISFLIILVLHHADQYISDIQGWVYGQIPVCSLICNSDYVVLFSSICYFILRLLIQIPRYSLFLRSKLKNQVTSKLESPFSKAIAKIILILAIYRDFGFLITGFFAIGGSASIVLMVLLFSVLLVSIIGFSLEFSLLFSLISKLFKDDQPAKIKKISLFLSIVYTLRRISGFVTAIVILSLVQGELVLISSKVMLIPFEGLLTFNLRPIFIVYSWIALIISGSLYLLSSLSLIFSLYKFFRLFKTEEVSIITK